MLSSPFHIATYCFTTTYNILSRRFAAPPFSIFKIMAMIAHIHTLQQGSGPEGQVPAERQL